MVTTVLIYISGKLAQDRDHAADLNAHLGNHRDADHRDRPLDPEIVLRLALRLLFLPIFLWVEVKSFLKRMRSL